jgi:molybdate transport system substrate-binding protein
MSKKGARCVLAFGRGGIHMSNPKAIVAVLALLVGSGNAEAAEFKILSAGALEPAMTALAADYAARTGDKLIIDFQTSAEMRERGHAGPLPVDLVATPDPLTAEFVSAGRMAGNPLAVGRIGIGVAIRTGDPVPDISTVPAFKAALLAAHSVLFNRASSGMGVEKMIQNLGLSNELAARTQRFPNAESVMKQLIAGEPGDLAMGAPTAISLYTSKGLRYVGTIPAELQSYTAYAVALTPGASPMAHKLMEYLSTPEARKIFAANGVMPQ